MIAHTLIFPFADLGRYRELGTVSSLSVERGRSKSADGWRQRHGDIQIRILLIQGYIEVDDPLIAVCT